MKKSLINLTRFLTILIFVISLLSAVVTSVFEVDFYQKTQAKYQVSAKMGISKDDVDKATLVALLYTKGHLKELSYEIIDNDNSYDLYSTQDKVHMVDVLNLYNFAYKTLIASTISAFIVGVILILKHNSLDLYAIVSVINKTSIYIIFFVGIISLFAYLNFDKFWVLFHEILFDNDLWLMDPRVDALVNLFPEGLFMDLVFKIIMRFIAFFGIFNGMAYGYKYFSYKRSSL